MHTADNREDSASASVRGTHAGGDFPGERTTCPRPNSANLESKEDVVTEEFV